MKKLVIILFISGISQCLLAQSSKQFVSDSSKPILQQQLLFQNRIIGKTNNGTIYALPQDNMPVLVPDSSFTSNMPNSSKVTTPGLQMPNPYYPGKQELKKLSQTNKGYQYKPMREIKKKIER